MVVSDRECPAGHYCLVSKLCTQRGSRPASQGPHQRVPRHVPRYVLPVVATQNQSAVDINQELTAALVEAGQRRGFLVETEYAVPGGRLDVVWCSDVELSTVGIEGPVPVVAFEIESSWRTRKHVKGDLLNILDSGASVGVIVLAGSDVEDESLLHFTRSLVERRGPDVRVWTAEDVRNLVKKDNLATVSAAGGSTPDVGDISPFAQHSGKYAELWRWLTAERRDTLTATFEEIEDRIGMPLPPSCSK